MLLQDRREKSINLEIFTHMNQNQSLLQLLTGSESQPNVDLNLLTINIPAININGPEEDTKISSKVRQIFGK